MSEFFRGQRSYQNVQLYTSLSTAMSHLPTGLISLAPFASGSIVLKPSSQITALTFYGQAADPPTADSLGLTLVQLLANTSAWGSLSIQSTGLILPIPPECFGLGAIMIVAAGASEPVNISLKS